MALMVTAAKALAGLSWLSLKPKSAALKVWLPSSAMVIVVSVPAGASLTELTVTVTLATLLSSDRRRWPCSVNESGPL